MATVKTNADVFEKAWEGFKGTDWKEKASVSRFVQANYTPYDGDESFFNAALSHSQRFHFCADKLNAAFYLLKHEIIMPRRPVVGYLLCSFFVYCLSNDSGEGL